MNSSQLKVTLHVPNTRSRPRPESHLTSRNELAIYQKLSPLELQARRHKFKNNKIYQFHVVFSVHLDINVTLCSPSILTLIFSSFNQRMHFLLSYFCSIHPTYVSAVIRPSSRYVDKFTSLFTSPFGIITTVTLYKAIIYIGNHQYTKFLQVVS